MPYYVIAVKPFGQLEQLAEFPAFAAASVKAKALRAAQAGGPGLRIKVMFANSPLEAEDLLLQVRDPQPVGDD